MSDLDLDSIVSSLYSAEKYSKMYPINTKMNTYKDKISFNDKLDKELDDVKDSFKTDILDLSISDDMTDDEKESIYEKIKEQFTDIVNEVNDVLKFDMDDNYSKNRVKRDILNEILPLYKLGVKTDWKTGEIVVDDGTLLEFIKNNGEEFKDVIGTFTGNVKTKMEKHIEQLGKEKDNYEKEISKLEDKTENVENYLVRYENNLVKQFSNLQSYVNVRLNNMSVMFNLLGDSYGN